MRRDQRHRTLQGRSIGRRCMLQRHLSVIATLHPPDALYTRHARDFSCRCG